MNHTVEVEFENKITTTYTYTLWLSYFAREGTSCTKVRLLFPLLPLFTLLTVHLPHSSTIHLPLPILFPLLPLFTLLTVH